MTLVESVRKFGAAGYATCLLAFVLLLGAAGKPPGHNAMLKWRPKSGEEEVDAVLRRYHEAVRGHGASGDQYLVIGVGFIGFRIVKALLHRGESRIRCVSRTCPPMLRALLEARKKQGLSGLEWVSGDVTQPATLTGPCAGVDTVFCTFATIRYWEALPHQRDPSYPTNVGGTEHVLEACRRAGVKRLVHTSTSNVTLLVEHTRPRGEPPVVFDETAPYAQEHNHISHYGSSKARAEKLILEANGQGGLATASVRPCSGVVGAQDVFFIQSGLEKQKVDNLVPYAVIDFVYVDNVVWGHLLVEKAMRAQDQSVLGEAFAISNEQPVSFLEFYSGIKHYEQSMRMDFPPYYLVHVIAYINRCICRYVSYRGPFKPLEIVTMATLAFCKTSYICDCAKARRVLGYQPLFSLDEGIMAAIREFRGGVDSAMS